jgi:hypothetical protein
MSRTTITNDNNRNKVTIDINLHELSIIQTSIALTMASIIETRRKIHDSGSISLDTDILERLYDKLDNLPEKLGKERKEKIEEKERVNEN